MHIVPNIACSKKEKCKQEREHRVTLEALKRPLSGSAGCIRAHQLAARPPCWQWSAAVPWWPPPAPERAGCRQRELLQHCLQTGRMRS